MSKIPETLKPIALILAILAVAALGVPTIGQEESSVLIEKTATPAVDGPSLPAPANGAALPPPAKPAVKPGEKSRAEANLKRPFMRPAEPMRRVPASTALQVVEEPMPAPASPDGPEIDVRPAPPIEYDTDGDARRMYRRYGEVELVMITKDPADGCFYEIPLCVPACCTGEPRVASGRGIFGRGVVEYCWASGFTAKVKFRHVLGDVKVEYEGD